VVIPEFCSLAGDLVGSGQIQRFAFDTYDREIRRYGGLAGIAAAETLFTIDSVATVDLLRAMSKMKTPDLVSVGVLSIHDLIKSLGLQETDGPTSLKGGVGAKHMFGDDFRERKVTLRKLLGLSDVTREFPDMEDIARVLRRRADAMESVRARFADLDSRGELKRPWPVILGSVLHMNCNRLLGVERRLEQRVLELVSRTLHSLERAPL
jgi:thiopeptide-type bacteriocin biosynthesis protein